MGSYSKVTGTGIQDTRIWPRMPRMVTLLAPPVETSHLQARSRGTWRFIVFSNPIVTAAITQL